jgi:hypothetical protein
MVSGAVITGHTAIWDLGRWVRSTWRLVLPGRGQWCDLINDNLVISENQSVGCLINTAETCRTSRSIWVGFAGIGVHF